MLIKCSIVRHLLFLSAFQFCYKFIILVALHFFIEKKAWLILYINLTPLSLVRHNSTLQVQQKRLGFEYVFLSILCLYLASLCQLLRRVLDRKTYRKIIFSSGLMFYLTFIFSYFIKLKLRLYFVFHLFHYQRLKRKGWLLF